MLSRGEVPTGGRVVGRLGDGLAVALTGAVGVGAIGVEVAIGVVVVDVEDVPRLNESGEVLEVLEGNEADSGTVGDGDGVHRPKHSSWVEPVGRLAEIGRPLPLGIAVSVAVVPVVPVVPVVSVPVVSGPVVSVLVVPVPVVPVLLVPVPVVVVSVALVVVVSVPAVVSVAVVLVPVVVVPVVVAVLVVSVPVVPVPVVPVPLVVVSEAVLVPDDAVAVVLAAVLVLLAAVVPVPAALLETGSAEVLVPLVALAVVALELVAAVWLEPLSELCADWGVMASTTSSGVLAAPEPPAAWAAAR